ncbi:MAG: CPBP family intramembrane metalloprotease [Oscillospiraceae bacterium]|jgi:membrane protease YdiL (CAAX protease family)|nr:CPBP family intramembrane metalloprotease [Oscillospiraceae bacterium]
MIIESNTEIGAKSEKIKFGANIANIKFPTQVGIAFILFATMNLIMAFGFSLFYSSIDLNKYIENGTFVYAVGFILLVLPVLLVFGILFRRDIFTTPDFKAELGFRRRDILVWLLIMFAVIDLAMTAGDTVYGLLYGVEEIPVPPETQGYGTRFVTALYSMLVAPILEEFVYRHGLYKPLKKCGGKYGTALAVIIPAVVFATTHGNLFQFVFALPAGLVLGIARDKFNCLAFSVAIHSFNNIAALFISELAKGTDTYAGIAAFLNLVLLLAGTALLVVALVKAVRRARARRAQVQVTDTADTADVPLPVENQRLTVMFWVGCLLYVGYEFYMSFG